MGDEGAAGEQERMICTAGAAIGALACVLRLTVTPRRDGADDHHAITPARRAADCSLWTLVTSRSVRAFGVPNGGDARPSRIQGQLRGVSSVREPADPDADSVLLADLGDLLAATAFHSGGVLPRRLDRLGGLVEVRHRRVVAVGGAHAWVPPMLPGSEHRPDAGSSRTPGTAQPSVTLLALISNLQHLRQGAGAWWTRTSGGHGPSGRAAISSPRSAWPRLRPVCSRG